ncbi:unnamed protein product [Cyclocybe aegerita]|uniref:Pre-rRNA-processing protein RIX1 N-terminal domain-containing protein n=1 Tax=Cyclocybe aegerita TaxID=1973307 RepID=A0A8S0WD91_CYCAE|nr:unnamed protein product [Cyclocybe aegerita]
MPEFQRQVAVPSVVKFTTTITTLAEIHRDVELKKFIMETLTRLVVLYPTTHKGLQGALSSLSLRYLSGSAVDPLNIEFVKAAARLYAALPVTGGKVGADGDPQVAVPLNLDRLRCAIAALCSLLSAPVQRPIQIPLGSVVKFVTALISCSEEGKVDGFIDPFTRSMEVAVVLDIHMAGSDLLGLLAEQFPSRLNAHLPKLLTTLCYFVLTYLKMDSSVLPTRIAKAVLPTITKIILTTSQQASGSNEGPSNTIRHGKKRTRNFEGDEVFKVSREVVCPTSIDGELLLASIDVVQMLFKNINISSAMKSIVARVIISILISLPKMPPSSISQDPNFVQELNSKIQDFAVLIASGTTSAMSKALPFIVEATFTSSRKELQSAVELLLHPRVPPLVRAMPHLESLSLLKGEESHQEGELLSSLAMQAQETNLTEDVTMKDNSVVHVAGNSLAVRTPEPAVTLPTQMPTTVPTTLPGLLPPPSPPAPIVEVPPLASTMQAVLVQNTVPKPNAVKSTTQLTALSGSTSESNRVVAVDETMLVISREEDGDKEEMPSIDMDSDSEVEEE